MNEITKVLIVEDDKHLAELVRRTVSDLGDVKVYIATTGEEARKLAETSGGFDCVFLDGNIGKKQDVDVPDTLDLIKVFLAINWQTHLVAHSGRDDLNQSLLYHGCHEAVLKGGDNYLNRITQAVVPVLDKKKMALYR